MPNTASEIAKLLQQVSAYKEGYRPQGERDIDKAAKMLGIVGDVGTQFQTYAKQALEMKAQELKNKDAGPVGDLIGVPSESDTTSTVQSTLNQAQNAPIPVQDLFSGSLDTRQKGIDTARQQALTNQNQRMDLQAKGINRDLSLEQNLKAAQIRGMQGGTDVYTHPTDASKPPIIQPRGNPPPAGYIYQGSLPAKTGVPLAVSSANANALVPAMTGTEAIGEGMVKKGTKIIPDQELPTYKKSELLKMSPEQLRGLGKYKTIDDTVENKVESENEIIGSILEGVNNLNSIRQTMSQSERNATLIPGGTGVGRLFSAPITNWETEKGLLAQRLAKLVERNRLSNEDRKFYLSLFSSPASTDKAFQANVNTLSSGIRRLEKTSPMNPSSSPKPGGVLKIDAEGNKAWMYPDGTYDEVP